MENNDILDYKNLYYDLKNKYDKLTIELEELKIDIKLKEEEINILRRKLNSHSNIIRINYLDNKDSSYIRGEDNNLNNNDNNNNSMYKQNNTKYDKYSMDSFRNDPEQGNDLLQELMKTEIEEMKLQNLKKFMKIEKNNFQILSNKLNSNNNNINIGDQNRINKTLTGDIDAILLNIKKKQESLHQTQKMFNLNNDEK